MKKLYIFLLLCATVPAFCQQTFPGNGKSGFGAAVGAGSLKISNDATTYSFTFTKGAGNFNDALVIYIDSKAGGFSSTVGFQDNNDGLRTATSGYSSATNKSILTFPAGFLPDYAVAFDQGFAAIVELVNGGPVSFNYIGSGNLTPTGNMTPVFSFSVLKSQIGITSDPSFKLLGTYNATSAFRSNEFVGDAGPAANPEFTDYTATTFNTYTGGVLPLQFSNFSLKKSAGNAVQLSWNTAQEFNVSHFDIMRSSNGRNYTSIATVAAKNTLVANTYTTTDLNPAKGNNFYKITSIDKDGKYTSTDILRIDFNRTASEIFAYKNGSDVRVNVANLDKGNYPIRLMNAQGQQVYAGTIIHKGENTSHTLTISKTLVPGVYHLTLLKNDSRLITSMIIQ